MSEERGGFVRSFLSSGFESDTGTMVMRGDEVHASLSFADTFLESVEVLRLSG